MSDRPNTSFAQGPNDARAAVRTDRIVKRMSRENYNAPPSNPSQYGSGAGVDTVVWPVKVTGAIADGLHDGEIRFVNDAPTPPVWTNALDGMSTMPVKIIPFPGKTLAPDDEGLARLIGQTPSNIVDDVETGLIPIFAMMTPSGAIGVGGLWEARLTESTGAADWTKRFVNSGGTWGDTSPPVTGADNAWPVELTGHTSGSFEAQATAKVLMWADPVTAGYYDLLPLQGANLVSGTYYAGYVVDGAQTWHGPKTFHHQIIIAPDGGDGPDLTISGTVSDPANVAVTEGVLSFSIVYTGGVTGAATFSLGNSTGGAPGGVGDADHFVIKRHVSNNRIAIYFGPSGGGAELQMNPDNGQLYCYQGFSTGAGSFIPGITTTATYSNVLTGKNYSVESITGIWTGEEDDLGDYGGWSGEFVAKIGGVDYTFTVAYGIIQDAPVGPIPPPPPPPPAP